MYVYVTKAESLNVDSWSPITVRRKPCGTEGKSVQFESSWLLEEIFVPYGEEKQGSMVTDIQDRISRNLSRL